MVLPDSLPTDINYDWYIKEAYRILSDIGAMDWETYLKLTEPNVVVKEFEFNKGHPMTVKGKPV